VCSDDGSVTQVTFQFNINLPLPGVQAAEHAGMVSAPTGTIKCLTYDIRFACTKHSIGSVYLNLLCFPFYLSKAIYFVTVECTCGNTVPVFFKKLIYQVNSAVCYG